MLDSHFFLYSQIKFKFTVDQNSLSKKTLKLVFLIERLVNFIIYFLATEMLIIYQPQTTNDGSELQTSRQSLRESAECRVEASVISPGLSDQTRKVGQPSLWRRVLYKQYNEYLLFYFSPALLPLCFALSLSLSLPPYRTLLLIGQLVSHLTQILTFFVKHYEV